ncbi:flavin reductase family protein [Paenibacillus silagei]|uniref:Flavin reductase (DIM6/NTAB) family NADH-FMN oxidoreductase RutF n=1 Tax=Paenibacillus silagei TaxID=1670801 RepID=A0ABS4NU32_9BACL|nr:flavin reductase family protein [Paenibacillus silagei]MBP2113561.1 flavin reductase (DIM6/NTAB) family NADH-FMN oxidoreductase RutF [Paenibacillus silagei]
MITIDPQQGTERDNYKLLVGTIIPRPIAFVTTLSEDGVLNGAPFSYFNIVSSNPPMISISIQHAGGQSKDTARNIKHMKEFVVHIVDEQNVRQVNMTAAPLPPDQSEVALAGMTPVDSQRIKVPGVQEAKVRMECVLEHCLELPNNDLVIGRIVQFHLDEEIYEQGRIDPVRLGAVSRLAGNNYAGIGEIFEIERPV